MRGLLSILPLALLLFGVGIAASAAADQLVTFSTASPPAAVSTAPIAQTRIEGYLTMPKGKGPFPAVVALHSCLGLPSNRKATTAALAEWGYASLFVDDFSTRGLKDTCAVDFPEGFSDAFGALAYLATLPAIDRTRIAALGFSQGAYTALQVATARLNPPVPLGEPMPLRFKLVAAYYPACVSPLGTQLALPTLILVGAADTVTPAADCERFAKTQSGADLKLVVYPGAGHVFDDPQFAGGKQLLGMHMEYNAAAAAAAEVALRDFLAARL